MVAYKVKYVCKIGFLNKSWDKENEQIGEGIETNWRIIRKAHWKIKERALSWKFGGDWRDSRA